MTSDSNLKRATTKLGEKEAESLIGHPEILDLADYQDGLLDERGSRAVETHLAVCRQCADMLLLLATPIELDETVESNKSAMVSTTRSWGHWGLWSAAAVFLGLFVLTQLEYRQLKHQLRAPRTSYQFQDLSSMNDPDRSQTVPITIPKDGQEITLLLHTVNIPTNKQYSVVLLKGNQRHWEGIVKPTEGQLFFGLTAWYQQPGRYQLNVFKSGVSSNKEIFDQFQFHLIERSEEK